MFSLDILANFSQVSHCSSKRVKGLSFSSLKTIHDHCPSTDSQRTLVPFSLSWSLTLLIIFHAVEFLIDLPFSA